MTEKDKDTNGLIAFRLERIDATLADHSIKLERLAEMMAKHCLPGQAPVCAVHERDINDIRATISSIVQIQSQHDKKLYAAGIMLTVMILLMNTMTAIFGPAIRSKMGIEHTHSMEVK